MPEQNLDDTDIDILLQQMGGEAMTQCMRRHSLLDAGGFRRLMNGAVELARRDGLEAVAARKQPAVREKDITALALAPPEPKQHQQLRRQHRVAVLAAFALFDPDP